MEKRQMELAQAQQPKAKTNATIWFHGVTGLDDGAGTFRGIRLADSRSLLKLLSMIEGEGLAAGAIYGGSKI